MKITSFCLLLLSLFISSCYDNFDIPTQQIAAEDIGFPQVGRSLIYQLDSTHYNEFSEDSTTHRVMYVKETVTDTFHGNNDSVIYRVVEYTKYNKQDEFQENKSFYYAFDNGQLIMQKDNARLLMLPTQVFEGTKWDPMAYTNVDFLGVELLDPLQILIESTCTSIDSTYTLDPSIAELSELKYENCISVDFANINQGDSQIYVDYIRMGQVYALGIGPIYKYQEAYVRRSQFDYRRGYKLEYKLISYE